MDVSEASDVDQQAVRRAMQYWVAHWDQECPTVFGIELDELKGALHSWPVTVGEDESELQAAVVSDNYLGR